jgi:hypothetical protein
MEDFNKAILILPDCAGAMETRQNLCQWRRRAVRGPDSLAGGPGFEPRLTESESGILPFRAQKNVAEKIEALRQTRGGRAPRRNGHILLLRLTLRRGDVALPLRSKRSLH